MKKYKYPPKKDCKFCKGTGIVEKAAKIGVNTLKEFVCICRFVNHEYSDEMATMLSKFATRELKKMRKKE